MKHIVSAAQDILSKNIVDVYTTMVHDVPLDAASYQLHFKEMSNYLLRIHSYTRFSDIVRDIEKGEWSVLLLFEDEHEGISYFIKEVLEKANAKYDVVRFT